MIHIAVFYVVLLLVAAFAWRRGGPPERATAGMMVAAALATSAVVLLGHGRFRSISTGLLAIDAALFAGLCIVTVRADRYWPIWVAALQLLALAIHGARAYDGSIVPVVYAWALGEIAYPMLALLVAGTLRHHRRTRAPAQTREPAR